jgi:hypothetical protein
MEKLQVFFETVSKLAHQKNITLSTNVVDNSSHNLYGMKASFIQEGNDFKIFVSKDLVGSDCQNALAHEIGHVYLRILNWNSNLRSTLDKLSLEKCPYYFDNLYTALLNFFDHKLILEIVSEHGFSNQLFIDSFKDHGVVFCAPNNDKTLFCSSLPEDEDEDGNDKQYSLAEIKKKNETHYNLCIKSLKLSHAVSLADNALATGNITEIEKLIVCMNDTLLFNAYTFMVDVAKNVGLDSHGHESYIKGLISMIEN